MNKLIVLTLILLLLFVSVLTGCTDDQSNDTAQNTQSVSTLDQIPSGGSEAQDQTQPASEPAERSNMDTTAENVNDQPAPVTEETEESFDDYVVEIGEDAEVGGN